MSLDTLYIFTHIHFSKGDDMKGNRKKEIFCAAAILLLLSSILLPMTTAQYGNFLRRKGIFYKQTLVEESDEQEYYVAFGPVGAKNINDCEIAVEMNESVFLAFKNDVELLNQKNLDTPEFIDHQLKLFIKYEITPKYFTLENLTEAIEELKSTGSKKSQGFLSGDTNLQIGRTTLGPHMIIYGSLFDAVVNFQIGEIRTPRPISDINKIVDIFNISRDSLLYDILYNTTIFRYLHYANINILFGGAFGFYLSLGLFPGIPSYQISKNPFIGIYVIWLGGGIYIYQGTDRWDEGIDNALFDFFIGFTPFSMVTYREFRNPIP
jgi:hypothetical protein